MTASIPNTIRRNPCHVTVHTGFVQFKIGNKHHRLASISYMILLTYKRILPMLSASPSTFLSNESTYCKKLYGDFYWLFE